MAWTAEASSLASVTAIASSPPQHSNAPLQSQQPLTLYIARVPGSRDVFLTPIKPREKIVTAEDVQSSLYYVHVSCEDDSKALESPKPSSTGTDAPQRDMIKQVVARKKAPPPLPDRAQLASPPYPADDQMPGFRPMSWNARLPGKIVRKPVLIDISSGQAPPVPAHLDLPDIPLRPLPTPPDEQPRRSSLHEENVRLLRRAEHSIETNPYFQKYESNAASDTTSSVGAPGLLTLIRRDPASSEQWNVGSIHDPPVQEVSSSALLSPGSARRTKRGGVPLYLDIINPGYSQFIDKTRPDSRTSNSTFSSEGEPPPEGTFRRRLYMPGSRYGEHDYGHRKARSVDMRESADMPRTLRNRMSVDVTGSSPSVDKRSKCYTFTSPWDGKCEFTTGATGKSLKCRHTSAQQGSAEVSELRFNLPTSSRNTPTPVAEKRSSYFSRHMRHLSHDEGNGSTSPTVIIDDDGRVDLELGQERAGGGFGGKQAKLGKLIIEPEGLKMLDLLVAANVGLWWRAYERK